MRIIYHHRTLGDGAEGIHIAEMVNAFRQLGNEVFVIGPGVGQKNGKEVRSKRFQWVRRICKGPVYEMVEIAYNFFGFINLCSKIRLLNPDFIYDRYITFNYSPIAAAKYNKIPVFLEVNSPLAYERDKEPDEKLYFKKIAYSLEKKICADATKTFVVSTPLKNYLLYQNVPSDKIIVLPNGVNTDRFYPCETKNDKLAAKYQIKDKDLIIGFLGILRPWHGIDMLLEAFKIVIEQHPQAKLLLVGDGPIKDNIVTMLDKSLREKVIITGRVNHEDIREYLSLFDIAISPKATFYASPMKIVEYMAAGVPTVAPDMENIRDLIIDRQTGMLFEQENHESLAGAIMLLVSNNQLRDNIKKKALDVVREKLNWRTNAQRVIQEYTSRFI